MTPPSPVAPLAARLWAQAQHKAFQCLYHPFVASLARGSLARSDFQAFLLQDAYFLNAFAQAFAFAATKTRTSQHTLAIVRRMGGIETELRTHSAFLASFGIDVFEVTDASAAPATRAYVDFLLTTAKRSDSVAEILAAMTPCMRLYAFLGQQIARAAEQVPNDGERAPNAYQRWIDSYSPAEFNAAADEAEQHLDELAAFEDVSYETLLPLYNMAMELELRFFEQYFPVERAAASFPPATLSFPMRVQVHVDPTDAPISPWEAPANGNPVDNEEFDLQALVALSPGHYEVSVIKTNEAQFVFEILSASSTASDSGLPLYSTLLAETVTPSSVAVAQSTAEVLAFLQTISARGSFEAYSHPAASYSRRVPRVLTIAGSDSGGGAGIQADMKACTNLGVFSSSALTAVTVQNTRGVHAIHAVPVNGIADQITCVLDDIGADVVKTGMLATEEVIEMVATVLEPRAVPLVVDPVMVATSGDRLLKEAAHEVMVQKLFPLATIITPNIPETSALLNDRVIESIDDMKQAARDLAAFGPAFVLVKGGHLKNPPGGLVHDVLLDVQRDAFHVITNPKLETRNTHGTGCTLAAAIAAQFAKSGDMVRAVRSAIAYLHGVLLESQALAIGTGDNGPMLHVA